MINGGPENRQHVASSLRRASWIGLISHVMAGACMFFILRHGFPTNPSLGSRVAFIAEHTGAWRFAWLSWTMAAVTLLWLVITFHGYLNVAGARASPAGMLAVCMTVAGVASDLAAHAIEMSVIPDTAARLRALQTGDASDSSNEPSLPESDDITIPESKRLRILETSDGATLDATVATNFSNLRRVTIVLSGYLANGLYSLATLVLTIGARRFFPALFLMLGIGTTAAGLALSAAALMDHVQGMYWSNVVLGPLLLGWLGMIALAKG